MFYAGNELVKYLPRRFFLMTANVGFYSARKRRQTTLQYFFFFFFSGNRSRFRETKLRITFLLILRESVKANLLAKEFTHKNNFAEEFSLQAQEGRILCF